MFCSFLNILLVVIFAAVLFDVSALPTGQDNALCGLIAATQVHDSHRLPDSSKYQWQCTPEGIVENDPCNSTLFWAGITCRNNILVELDLSTFLIKGTIPSALGELTTLTTLVLSSNCMNGTIPSELFNLRQLTLVSIVLLVFLN